MSQQYISREGRQRLEAELHTLKFTERPKIVAEIKRTRELGDLSENAEYHAAKEAQRHLERKISELEQKIARSQVIDTSQIPSDKVYLFATVVVRDTDDGEEITYKVVPADEADVDNDIISVASPIGKGLLGKSVGEIAEIPIPAGILRYEIIDISRDD